MSNRVYIATSLDGFIADANEGLDWLHSVPNPTGDDLGFADFLQTVDALVMGRKTFEMVASFDVAWPYPVPVAVLSNTMTEIPEKFQDKAFLVKGSPREIMDTMAEKGLKDLYIDGGKTVQGFLEADLVDDLIVSRIPIVLGGGVPLFGKLAKPQHYRHIKTDVLLDAIVKTHYRRAR